MLVSMDASMRSTGLVSLKPDNTIAEFGVIKTTKDEFPDTEDLLIYICRRTLIFIKDNEAKNFVIEGLSFSGKSSHKDILAGIYWSVRMMIWKNFPDILIGSIPVTAWRSKVLNKEERKYAKENYSPQNEAIKIATVKKLPPHIHKEFVDYCNHMSYNLKTMYDLADAYFLGLYRNSLNA